VFAAPAGAAPVPYAPATDRLGGALAPSYGPLSLRRAPTARMNWKPVLILMDFNDLNGKGTQAYFKDMLFGRHPTDGTSLASFPYQNLSMADLYASMSAEALVFADPIVVDWKLAPKPYTYYTEYSGSDTVFKGCYGLGQNSDGINAGAPALVIEALKKAEAAGVDLVALDDDADQTVDGIFVVHAGAGAEQTSGDAACTKDAGGNTTFGGDIWSHQYYVSYQPVNAASSYLFHYLIGPAESHDSRSANGLAAMGVWAHEFGHMLDLPDLYAPTTADGYGVGCWDLMGYGIRSCSPTFNGADPGEDPNEMSVWTRTQLGWAAPRAVTENVCNRDVAPVQYGGETFKVVPDAARPGDYFLVEYRGAVGFDKDLLSFSSDDNLNRVCVWHIDDAQASNFTPNGTPCDPAGSAACPTHYGVMLTEFDGNYSLLHASEYIEAGDCVPQGQMMAMTDRKDLKTWSVTGTAWSVAAGPLQERGRVSITVDPNTPAVKPAIVGTPGDALRGANWTYAPKVKTPSGMAQWRLVTGPKGMVIDETTGKVAWRVPAGFGASKVKVTVAVSNCGGETEQTFSLVIVDDEPAGCGCRTAGGPGAMDVLPFLLMYVVLRLLGAPVFNRQRVPLVFRLPLAKRRTSAPRRTGRAPRV
jgi:M6 family metalloprotease-like protein